MDKEKLKNLLRKYNLKPNFTFGQNFLVDEGALSEIVRAADVSSADSILEIGPGIGNLTVELLKIGAKVFSVEKDQKFLPILRSIKDKYQNFEFAIGDFLDFDLENFNAKRTYKVVANIPYFITGKILRKLFAAWHKPSRVVLLTQKEVAEKITAKAGNMSLVGISVQIFGEPKIIGIVKSESFFPAPKVDSAIIRIETYKKSKYKIEDEQKFFKVVKGCFLGKRKQIHNTLKNNLGLKEEQVSRILKTLDIDLKTRPQELPIEKWVLLYELITKNHN